METKKVIEQGDEYDITINIQEGYISLSQTDDLSTDVVIIRPAYTTEAAKAIDPKYQETEDENKILKNQIELIFKNANNKIESLEQKNAKLSELLSDYSRNTEQQLAEKDKVIERLKDEKDEALRLLNDALKLIHSLPDLLHDSLGECSDGNDYEIISINGERWINHKVVGSGEPLKQWIKSEIDKSLNK